MANANHLERLQQGGGVWNAWRSKEPSVRPDLRRANLNRADLGWANLGRADLGWANLSGADLIKAGLSGADLREAKLSGADLSGADLGWANLSRADLRRANLSRADLRRANLNRTDLGGANLGWADLGWANLAGANLSGVNLSEANLGGADLREANLSRADLREAKLSRANLQLVNLVGARLDRADLTGARLWETQRGGWSIKDIICQRAFWDREGKEPTEYGEGEFEHRFAEKPRIVLRYPGGISPVELFALPLIVKRLEDEQPDSALRIRSVQDDANGVSVTIVVEDRAGRDAEAFEHECMHLQTKLKCIVEERDFLRQRLELMFSEGLSKVAQILAHQGKRSMSTARVGKWQLRGPP